MTSAAALLTLCAAFAAGPAIDCYAQDWTGSRSPGFALEDCPEIICDEISRFVAWKPGSSLRKLAGTPIRLRLVMKHADLYAIRFTYEGAEK